LKKFHNAAPFILSSFIYKK